jgi:hypothetical protein
LDILEQNIIKLAMRYLSSFNLDGDEIIELPSVFRQTLVE